MQLNKNEIKRTYYFNFFLRNLFDFGSIDNLEHINCYYCDLEPIYAEQLPTFDDTSYSSKTSTNGVCFYDELEEKLLFFEEVADSDTSVKRSTLRIDTPTYNEVIRLNKANIIWLRKRYFAIGNFFPRNSSFLFWVLKNFYFCPISVNIIPREVRLFELGSPMADVSREIQRKIKNGELNEIKE